MKKIIILMGITLLTSCAKITYIDNLSPYNTAIGKKFILKRDAYVYRYQETEYSYPFVGMGGLKNGAGVPGLPDIVTEKFINTLQGNKQITGIYKAGEVFAVHRIKRFESFENSYNKYEIRFIKDNKIFETIHINVSFNPPISNRWSDPPIFDKEFAIPHPDDGVWWK